MFSRLIEQKVSPQGEAEEALMSDVAMRQVVIVSQHILVVGEVMQTQHDGTQVYFYLSEG